MKKLVFASALALLIISCTHRPEPKAQDLYHPFPEIQIPSVYGSGQEAFDYGLEHWWDAYFSKGGPTDSAAILGVRKGELEQLMSNYVSALENIPLPRAQECITRLFGQVEKCQEGEPEESLAYLRFTELVAKYLYDPNSPVRNEDLFLPFVRGLATSKWTREDMRPGYEYQARMCALNQFGQQVPDFQFKDAKGKVHHLFEVKSAYTMLFFSNPGCTACKEIIDQVCSRDYIDKFISGGLLTVVNIYIDEEIDKWLEYEPNYPRNWLTGYDHLYRIREEQNYDIRAIPSLYLLDANKRVIMKDAPTERVLSFFDNLAYGS